MTVSDPIAAVSTPRGKGGIAVIRISGKGTDEILHRVFTCAGKDPVAFPRHASFGRIQSIDGTVLDEGLAVFFRGPASYTGEDLAEISCHGGVLLTQTVLAAVFEAGARPAEAGEYTRRAVLNGKLRLSEAEALGAVLSAGTAGQLELARGGMEGRLADAVRGLYERLSLVLADIYAGIDFPDEDLNSMDRGGLSSALSVLREETVRLSDTWQTGHAVAEGINTVICGPVNAGKSTLYNALVGYEAALVTDVAGTTRDILRQTVSLGQVTLSLSDTAGLRETGEPVERLGVQKARKAMDEAELILFVVDAGRAPEKEEEALLSELAKTPDRVILILNKADLPRRFPEKATAAFPHTVQLSAAGGDLSPLRAAVESVFLHQGLDLRADAVVANARQYAALRKAGDALKRALTALSAGEPTDAVCTEAEAAMAALGEVDGRTVDEEILSAVFAHFCVGK